MSISCLTGVTLGSTKQLCSRVRLQFHLIQHWAMSVSVRTKFTVSSSPTELLNFVNGQRSLPKSASHKFAVFEPSTGRQLCECAASGDADVEEAVGAAQHAFPAWSALTGFERGQILKTAASLIRENLEDIAHCEVRDNGKPVCEARADIGQCADTFDFYGGAAATIMGEHIPLPGGNFAYTRREPFGVCAGIGAWNYPFQTASWKMAPALACGNTFVYKPSPLAPVTAVILAEILTAAGVPAGGVNVLQGEAETGAALCLHEGVSKVSFTGSVPTGQRIMQACAARGLKPLTLELGGKSPLIIFEDVSSLDNAVTGAMMANFYTQGEVCSNASRVFVHRSLVPQFCDQLVERTLALKVGDPHDESTRVGASISKEHVEKVLGYIDGAKQQGARVLCGGERVAVPGLEGGYYVSPCVVADATDEMRVTQEEIFGAVLLVLPFDSEQEAVRRANDTPYGLAAGLFTSNLQRAHRVAAQLRAGSVSINSFNVTPVELPFGGYKMSGFGRECGLAALHNYTQLKSVYVDIADTLDGF